MRGFEVQDVSLSVHLSKDFLVDHARITLACESHGQPARLIWASFRTQTIGYHFMVDSLKPGSGRRGNVYGWEFMNTDLRPMLEDCMVTTHGMDALQGALVAGVMARTLAPFKEHLFFSMAGAWPEDHYSPGGEPILDEKHSYALAMLEKCRSTVRDCRGELAELP